MQMCTHANAFDHNSSDYYINEDYPQSQCICQLPTAHGID